MQANTNTSSRCRGSPSTWRASTTTWTVVNCYVVLTTAPNASVQGIHDRMPLILSHEQVRPWLTDPQAALTLLTILPPALQKTCEDGQLSFADLA